MSDATPATDEERREFRKTMQQRWKALRQIHQDAQTLPEGERMPHVYREWPKKFREMEDADWIKRYTEGSIPAPATAAERVALADAAPKQFRQDTGREPPGDLIARVFAAMAPK